MGVPKSLRAQSSQRSLCGNSGHFVNEVTDGHHNNMKTATTNAPSAPDTSLATATPQAPVIVIRKSDTVRSLLKIGADGSVEFTKGCNINADEIAQVVTDECNAQAKRVEFTVNLIRLTRALPKVGDTSAFDYACAKVEADCATKATWHGVRALIEYADIRDANNLTGSVYVIKEWTSYARKMGLLGTTDAAGKVDPLKLTDAAKVDPVIAIALAGNAKVNAIREPLKVAKAKRNAEDKAAGRAITFPTRATSADAAKATVEKVSVATPAIVLHSMSNARYAITKICETAVAGSTTIADLKKLLLADEAVKSIMAFLAGK